MTKIDIVKSSEAYLEFYKALTSGDTGFPEVPEVIARDIIEYIWKKTYVRQLFPWITMDSDIVKWYVESGTVEVYSPASEGLEVEESKILFGTPVELVAKEIRAWTSITDVASEEAKIDVIARSVMHLGRKFAECEERNALTGNGSGSDAYNLFTGLSRLTSSDGAKIVDLEKRSLTIDDISNALSYFEERGYADSLVCLLNPFTASYLRKDLSDKGLDTLSSRVISSGELPTIYGVKIVETSYMPRRDYSQSDPTQVSDVVICNPSLAAVGGDRRRIIIERDRDVKKGLTIIVASERFAWRILRPDAVYIIKNVLSQ
ncbi:MAG: phage major capsid protein [Thaumarchaeota archaeon]|jgi:HK97 family phage major capsid protein|nr:phage major capsid protein [Candidatus Geocrenenecus arthurdayi]